MIPYENKFVLFLGMCAWAEHLHDSDLGGCVCVCVHMKPSGDKSAIALKYVFGPDSNSTHNLVQTLSDIVILKHCTYGIRSGSPKSGSPKVAIGEQICHRFGEGVPESVWGARIVRS